TAIDADDATLAMEQTNDALSEATACTGDEHGALSARKRRGSYRDWRAERRVDHASSEEDALSRFETAIDHRLHGRLHDEDLLFDDGVIVVGIAAEAHRLAEVDAVTGRQRERSEGQEQLREDRHVRH